MDLSTEWLARDVLTMSIGMVVGFIGTNLWFGKKSTKAQMAAGWTLGMIGMGLVAAAAPKILHYFWCL